MLNYLLPPSSALPQRGRGLGVADLPSSSTSSAPPTPSPRSFLPPSTMPSSSLSSSLLSSSSSSATTITAQPSSRTTPASPFSLSSPTWVAPSSSPSSRPSPFPSMQSPPSPPPQLLHRWHHLHLFHLPPHHPQAGLHAFRRHHHCRMVHQAPNWITWTLFLALTIYDLLVVLCPR